VTSLEMPGPLISKSQSGRVNLRATQQIGRTWTERYLVNVRSVNGRALLAFVDNVWRNGTTFTIDHRDHITPLGTGGGSPLINQPTQLVVDPENFGNWPAWTGTVTKTSGQSDEYGTTAAYLLDADVAGEAIRSAAIPYAGNGTKGFAMSLRAGTSVRTELNFYDNTAAASRFSVRAAWSAGVPTVTSLGGSGTIYAVESRGGGWYRIPLAIDNIVAANTNYCLFYPAGFLTGTTYAFGANAWNSTVPAGYIGPSHLTATGSTLYIDGATASVATWLRAGDIIGVGGLSPVYEVTADTASLAGGYVPLPVNPPIFTGGAPSDNAVVTITGVMLTACILEPPTYPTTSGPSADYGEMSIKFSESL
jgi:hypothetical protein